MSDEEDRMFDDNHAPAEADMSEQPTEPIEPVAEVVAEPDAEPEEPVRADAAPSAPDAALVEGVSGGLTWLPFAVYLGLWVVFAAVSAYLLYDATPSEPARYMPEYVPLLWGGIGLTALGPLLSLGVWLVARAKRPKPERRGLFSSAMTRGALVAFFGVALWLGTLFVLELAAAGWQL